MFPRKIFTKWSNAPLWQDTLCKSSIWINFWLKFSWKSRTFFLDILLLADVSFLPTSKGDICTHFSFEINRLTKSTFFIVVIWFTEWHKTTAQTKTKWWQKCPFQSFRNFCTPLSLRSQAHCSERIKCF